MGWGCCERGGKNSKFVAWCGILWHFPRLLSSSSGFLQLSRLDEMNTPHHVDSRPVSEYGVTFFRGRDGVDWAILPDSSPPSFPRRRGEETSSQPVGG